MNRKLILTSLVLLLVGTASAAIISEYFIQNTHASVEESISIDNYESWISMYGGESQDVIMNVENKANVDITGRLKTSYSPDGKGLSTFYSVNGELLTDDDDDGDVELTIPAESTITVTKIISAMPNIAAGDYLISTEMKAI